MNEKQRAAAERLIDVFDRRGLSNVDRLVVCAEAAALLRELAAEPVQEPVAYADKIAFESAMAGGKGCDVWPKAGDYIESTGRELVPLYTHPPQQRKPLTEEQMNAILHAEIERDSGNGCAGRFARAIEKAHGIGEAP